MPPSYGTAQRQAFDALIDQQNQGLARSLRELALQRGLQMWQPDFNGLLRAALTDPEIYGLVEVVRPVLQEAQAATPAPRVTDATGFLWWDSRAHFCTAFHQRLAGPIAYGAGPVGA